MTITISMPEPLDPTVYHTREQYRDWQRKMAAYYDEVRAEEARQREEQKQRDNPPPHYLDDAAYDKIRRAEWQADMDRRKQWADAEAAKAQAKANYMASTPDVAEILAADPFTLLQEVVHWAAKGYTLPDDGIQHFVHGCFTVRMTKPTTARKQR